MTGHARSRWLYLGRLAVVAAAYYGLAKFGLSLAFANSSVTAVWPPTGLALASVLIWGYRMWPAIALGALLANVSTPAGLDSALGITAGNTLEALVGAYLLSLVGFRRSLERVRDVIALALLAGGLSTMVSASIGVSTLWATGALSGDDVASAWRVWWLGDMGGDLTIAPALLVAASRPRLNLTPLRIGEAVALTATLVLVSALVFSRGSTLGYAVFPLIFLAALRFNQPGAVAAGLVVSGFAIFNTANGEGPFVGGAPDDELLRAQAFLGVATITALLVAVIRTEGRQAMEAHAMLAEAQALAHIGNWEWDIPADEVTWSDELYRVYGLDRTTFEASYAGFLERVHPRDREAVDAQIQRAFEKRSPFSFTHRIVRPDGEVRTLRAHGEVICGADGVPATMRGTGQDVTELREAEAERRHLAAIVESSDDAIVGESLDGTISSWNAGAERLYGYTAAEMIGEPVSVLIPDDRLEEAPEILERIGRGERVEHFETVRLDRNRRPVEVSLSVSPVIGPGGEVIGTAAIARDITERKRFEARLRFAADHDALTGRYNRRRFNELLSQQVELAKRYGHGGAVLILDLDNFKGINDTLGHDAGDHVLRATANVIEQRLRSTDALARLGGDEFAVLLPHVAPVQASKVASDLLDRIRDHPFVAGAQRVRVTASIGVALFERGEGEVEADTLLTSADLAMYEAKEQGRDRLAIYSAARRREAVVEARIAWSERIRAALAEDAFVLHLQPIMDLATGGMSVREALVRMRGDNRRLIPPGSFLAAAERSGLIKQVDRWVIREAIELIARFGDAGEQLTLGVNISGLALGDRELPRMIEACAAEHRVDPHSLIFEVTETAAIANIEEAREFAGMLTGLGCRFALDDFGAGFSSFFYLKYLPLDYVKIDGEFIRRLPVSEVDQVLVRGIVDVAKGLGVKTIAEFVGDDETVDLLHAYGVDYVQGFHVGRPEPVPAEIAAPSLSG